MRGIYEVPIMSKAVIAPGVTEVTLDISKTNFRFTAGQYATITLPDTTDQPTTSQFHDFSIASSPNNHNELKIAFRNSASFFKTTFLGLPLGALVILEGPFGNFTLPDETDKPIVCIAGGIGVTPFMSMFAFITEMKQPYHITLFYSNRDTVSTTYASDLQHFAKLNPSLKTVFTMTNDLQWRGETKAIEGDFVAAYIGDLTDYLFYIAGPPAMVFAIQDDLRRLGVADANIRTEGFTGIEIEQVLTGSDYNALMSSLDKTALISMTDDKGHIVYANNKFVEVSKYPLKELLGQNHRILKSGHQPDQLFEELWATISSGKVWRGEIKNKAKDGTFYWVDTSIAPIMGAGKRPERYISVRFLITDKKEREEALQKAKAMDDAILSGIDNGLIGADQNGKIILVNPAAESLLERDANEVLGKPIEEAFTLKDTQGNDIPAQNRPFRQVLATKKATAMPADYYFVRKDGEKLSVAVSAFPIILDNLIIGVVEIFRKTQEKKVTPVTPSTKDTK